MAIQKFRKLPDANMEGIQYTGSNYAEITAWCPKTTYADGKLTMYGGIEVPATCWVMQDHGGNYLLWPDDQLHLYYTEIGTTVDE